jgi:hypothetical protein
MNPNSPCCQTRVCHNYREPTFNPMLNPNDPMLNPNDIHVANTLDCVMEVGDECLLIHKPVVISFDTVKCDIYSYDACDCCQTPFVADLNLKIVAWAWGDAEPKEKLQLLSFKLCSACYDFNKNTSLVIGETIDDAVQYLCRPGDTASRDKDDARRKKIYDAGIATPSGVVPVQLFTTTVFGSTEMWNQDVVINKMYLSLKVIRCELNDDPEPWCCADHAMPSKCDCCLKPTPEEELQIKYTGWENRHNPSFNFDIQLLTFKLCEGCYEHNKHKVMTRGRHMWDAMEILVKPCVDTSSDEAEN